MAIPEALKGVLNRTADRRLPVRLQLVSAFLLAFLAVGAGGCAYTPLFGFPRESGNVEAGRQAFIDHQCHRCHSVAGERLPLLAGADDPILELGGETIYVKSYADLMTSVINPEHRISERYRDQMVRQGVIPIESPMPQPHVDTMTVRQLIDLVSFLDARYQLIEGYDANF
jgi:mono/diheme cytochrome c family protein